MLFHTADTGAPLTVRDICGIHAANGNRAVFRLVKPEQKAEYRAFPGACPANQGYVFTFFHGEGKVRQHRMLSVAKRHMRKPDIAVDDIALLRGKRALRLIQKSIDSFGTCHGGLNGLNFHTETFDRRKNAGDVVDDCDRCADRHAKQRKHFCIAGSGKQHDNTHHGCVDKQYHRRVNCVVEIGLFHGGITGADAFVIPARHISLQPQHVDSTDVVQRFRHLTGHGGDSAAVVQLRPKHFFLNMPCKNGKKREDQQ